MDPLQRQLLDIVDTIKGVSNRVRKLETLPITPPDVLWCHYDGNAAVMVKPNRFYNRYTEDRHIKEVFISVNTAPTGNTIIVDLLLDGLISMILSANRPTIQIGQFTGFTTTIEVPVWPVGSYIQVEIIRVGSVIPGANLVVQVMYA